MTVHLSYATIFTRDVERLPDFYVAAFGLVEDEASRSHRYRQIDAGTVKIGFPYVDAYANLGLADQAEPTGVRAMLTLATADASSVDRITERAVALGARLTRPGFQTDFGQYLSVILDPEGNAVRISAMTQGTGNG